MAVVYDSAVINREASKLYERAGRLVVTYVLSGVLVGLLGGTFFALNDMRGGGILPLAGILVLGALGYALGTVAAERLRLQAQQLLVQVAIEENTRRLFGGT